MKTTIRCLTWLSALAAFGAHAAPADHEPAFTRVAEFLSRTDMCELIGYRLDAEAERKAMAPAVERAVADGMSGKAISDMVQHTGTAVNARQLIEALDFKAQLDAAAGPQALTGAIRVYFVRQDDTCRAFSASPDFSALIAAPADAQNAAGFQAFHDTILAAHRSGQMSQ